MISKYIFSYDPVNLVLRVTVVFLKSIGSRDVGLCIEISQVEVDIGDLPSRLTKDLLAKYLFSFELNGAEVRDLTGLEAAENLQVITLRNNLITDLTPLSGLKKLRSVDLRGNRVNSLESLKDLPSLRELDLSQNKLKAIAVGTELILTLGINIASKGQFV